MWDIYLKITNYILEKIIFIFMIMLVSSTVLQVFVRFLTTLSVSWTEEASRYLMICLVFVASIIAYRRNIHIVVDNIRNLFPKVISYIMEFFSYVASLIFIYILLQGTFKVIPIAFGQTSPALHLVMAYPYLVLPITMTIMSIDVLHNIYLLYNKVFLNLKGK